MAYKAKLNLVNISFDESHKFYGLNLKMRSCGVVEFGKIAAQSASVADAFKASKEDASKISMVVDLINDLKALFASKLVEWDYELEQLDGSYLPLSADIEGVSQLEDIEFMQLLEAWMDAVAGVPESLGKGSTSGVNYPVVPIQMVPLSQSQAS